MVWLCPQKANGAAEKKKKDDGAKVSFPEKGTPGDAVQHVIRFPFWGLGQ